MDITKQSTEGSLTLRQTTERQLSKTFAKNVTLQNQKSELPFAIINVDAEHVPQYLFHVPEDRALFNAKTDGKSKFAVVTGNGTLIVFDTLFRRMVWRNPGFEELVNWGEMIWDVDESKDPTIVLHSRKCGLFQVFPETCDRSDEDHSKTEMLSRGVHSGFCKPCMCSEEDILVPVDLNQMGILSRRNGKWDALSLIHKFDTTLMALKLLKSENDNGDKLVYIASSTEDGNILLLEIKKIPVERKSENDDDEYSHSCIVISKFRLPKDKKENEHPIGTCMTGSEDILVVGTTGKAMYLFKVSREKPYSLLPFGKKTLPADGVGCMSINVTQNVMVAGCHDGTVRLFSFPDMNQMSVINYHNGYLNSLIFVNDKSDNETKSYLVCASNTPAITVWKLSFTKK